MILGFLKRITLFLVSIFVSDQIALLKTRVPLEQVAGAVVELRDSGKSLSGRCPFHSESTPSFHVYKGENRFHCFGCAADGDTLDFIQKFYRLEQAEAIGRLKELAGTPDPAWQKSAQVFQPPVKRDDKSYRVYGLEEWQKPVDRLFSHEGILGRAYLEKRGIGGEVAKRLRIGYRTDGTRFVGNGTLDTDENRERHAIMRDSGWIGLPYIEKGKVVSVKWRAIADGIHKDDRFRFEANMKPCGVFNSDAVDPFDELFVTEGELDAATLEQAGFRAVAIKSASQKIDPQTKDLLIRAERIFLAGDNEQSGIGIKAMERLLKDLGDKSHMILWPRADNETKKDANAYFVSDCSSNLEFFRCRVLEFASEARKPTSPHFKAVSAIIRRLKNGISPLDDPRRFRWPWAEVDSMVNLIPGDTCVLLASKTGSGKSAMSTQAVNYNAMEIPDKKTVIYWTPDLKPERHARLMVAQVSQKERMLLCAEDYDVAAREMEGAQIYLGYDPDARTAMDVLDICEQAIRRLGADIFVIDHIHYILRGAKDSNRVQLAEDVMKRINDMNERYQIISILVAQPRKDPSEPGKPKDRMAELDDVKYAQAIVEDAAAVLSIHRKRLPQSGEEGQEQQQSPETLVRMLKGREQAGGKQSAWLYFEGAQGRFRPMQKMYSPEPFDD